MKILSVSDRVEPFLFERIHAEKTSKIELILSCGDLPPEYLTSLANTFDTPLFYVKGNHDIRYGVKPPEGCTNIHNRLVEFNGLKLLGLEGSRWYNGGPYQYTEKQMQKIIRGLKLGMWWQGGVDVIISHAPPRHVNDAEDRCHRGFKSFHRLIERYTPKYFIHGHIHAEFKSRHKRITSIQKTKVVNSYGHFFFEIDIQRKTSAD